MSEHGLNDIEVENYKKQYGSNIISKKTKNTFLKLFIESLGDPIIRILLIALCIKFLFLISEYDWYETIGIAIAIFLASFISSISEYGGEKAFKNLQEQASKMKCKVFRNKVLKSVYIDDIVVGDLILLQSGDKVPADGNIVSGFISVDESSITGETRDVKKRIGDKLFKGTIVCDNECKFLCCWIIYNRTLYWNKCSNNCNTNVMDKYGNGYFCCISICI